MKYLRTFSGTIVRSSIPDCNLVAYLMDVTDAIDTTMFPYA